MAPMQKMYMMTSVKVVSIKMIIPSQVDLTFFSAEFSISPSRFPIPRSFTHTHYTTQLEPQCPETASASSSLVVQEKLAAM
jgi:hypothetical protein